VGAPRLSATEARVLSQGQKGCREAAKAGGDRGVPCDREEKSLRWAVEGMKKGVLRCLCCCTVDTGPLYEYGWNTAWACFYWKIVHRSKAAFSSCLCPDWEIKAASLDSLIALFKALCSWVLTPPVSGQHSPGNGSSSHIALHSHPLTFHSIGRSHPKDFILMGKLPRCKPAKYAVNSVSVTISGKIWQAMSQVQSHHRNRQRQRHSASTPQPVKHAASRQQVAKELVLRFRAKRAEEL